MTGKFHFVQIILLCVVIIKTASTRSTRDILLDLYHKVEVGAHEVYQLESNLRTDLNNFEIEKHRFKSIVNENDVINLNIGGKRMSTLRKTLTKVNGSLLALIFNGEFSAVVQPNRNGYFFFDYNPISFSHLLDQLRNLETTEKPNFKAPSAELEDSFRKILIDFNLPYSSSVENELIDLNVAGRIFKTSKKTLALLKSPIFDAILQKRSGVKRDRFGRPFLDFHPDLFQHLLDNLRTGNEKFALKSPSRPFDKLFGAMLEEIR